MHVAEVVRLHSRDDDHKFLHSEHQRPVEEIEERILAMKAAETQGTPCDMRHKLAYLAGRYVDCHPIRQDLKIGWYDRPKVFLKVPKSIVVSHSLTLSFSAVANYASG